MSNKVEIKQIGANQIILKKPARSSISLSAFKGGVDLAFIYTQSTPSAVWEITHGLTKKPSVTILDSSGYEIEADIQHISDNSVIITFSEPITGSVHFN